MFDLQPHKTYRIAYTIGRRDLRGVLCVFLGMGTIGQNVSRAKVRVLGTDEEYLVARGQIIPF